MNVISIIAIYELHKGAYSIQNGEVGFSGKLQQHTCLLAVSRTVSMRLIQEIDVKIETSVL